MHAIVWGAQWVRERPFVLPRLVNTIFAFYRWKDDQAFMLMNSLPLSSNCITSSKNLPADSYCIQPYLCSHKECTLPY